MNTRVIETLKTIHPVIMSIMDAHALSKMSSAEVAVYLKPLIPEIFQKMNLHLEKEEQEELEKKLLDEMTGYGPLEVLLKDETVSDILVNGANKVFVEREGQLSLTPITFWDNAHLMKIIYKMLHRVGRRVDETSPYVDTRLPDGSRINVIIPPLAMNGPTLSIRKFNYQKLSLVNLIENKTLTSAQSLYLSEALKNRLNILITGGAGAGKTTLLNALLQTIDPSERIITIEDVVELKLDQPHVVSLETRPANAEGRGEVSQRMLFKNALRMRPNRIIVGEVRGAEIFDMLQAMNSGHDGSISTIHASSIEEVSTRIMDMVIIAGVNYPAHVIARQISECINLIVEIKRLDNGKRLVSRIAKVTGYLDDKVLLQDVIA